MPRRIPDYPDAYEGWNEIASVGSLITLLSSILFLYIFYDVMVNNNKLNKIDQWDRLTTAELEARINKFNEIYKDEIAAAKKK